MRSERLDLGLLIDAEHDRALGRVEIEPDDVADLVDELRVLGELPGLLAVRLQPERPPDPQHRRLRQPDLARPSSASTSASRPWACVSSVLTITSSTCSSVIVRGRPGRGSSISPSSRCSANRARHLRDHRCDAIPNSRGDLGVVAAPRPPPTRSASATPTPARSSAAAPTTPTARARHRDSSIGASTEEGMTPPSPLAHELMHHDTRARRAVGDRGSPAPRRSAPGRAPADPGTRRSPRRRGRRARSPARRSSRS